MTRGLLAFVFSGLIIAGASPSGVFAQTAENKTGLGDITVTGSREEQPKAETAATVDMLAGQQIRDTKPSHPAEIMNQVPGVWVNPTSGEGHTTSIRQPVTTSPVYLYLEDGIPIRSTGFFNHNALYEVNIPQADSVEVTKGPGTALYGSDAIGGVINSMTRPAPMKGEGEVNLEGGSYGWSRALLTGGNTWDDNGLRADLNLTHTDGWRKNTKYDRQSGTLRWDSFFSTESALKTILAYSNIDQNTAGTATLSKEDYENNPTQNYAMISWRKVEALRLSAEYEKESGGSLYTLTPYVRKNKLSYIANWSLSYDPAILDTKNDSVGVMAKWRGNFAPMRSRVIVGVDVDHSPGKHDEQAIKPAKDGKVYTSYTLGDYIYDYNVTYTGISPYVHAEASPTDKLRVNAGLRYDNMGFDYNNNLSDTQEGSYRRPADTKTSYTHLSPKAGMTYEFTPALNGFLSYRHAFRAPSESQLFRQGKSINTVDLKPVKADSYETGLRGKAGSKVSWELSYYYMTKQDDILTYKYPDKSTETVNAGKTLHTGLEAGGSVEFSPLASLNVSVSYARHTYEDWKPQADIDYSGNEIPSAPRLIADTRLDIKPAFLGGGKVELDWTRLGEYWMDDANTHQYSGHNLFNVRANYVAGAFEIYGRVMNVTDEKWASSASYSSYAGEEYAPGMPVTFYGGVTYNFK